MVNSKRFKLSAGIGVSSIALMAALFLSAQQAFPFFIGNVGTFMVKADTMDAEQFGLTPGIDANSNNTASGQLPTGEITADSISISGMVMEKVVDVSSVIGDIPQAEWKLQISATSPVTLGNTTLNAVGLCASDFVAENFTFDAMGANTATFTDDFELGADSVSLTDVGIEAGYLATSSLSLSGLTLSMTPGGYDAPDCLPNN